LSEPDLDSLWYERLASTALLHEDNVENPRRLFQLALEKKNPSWLSHRGLGTTYDREQRFAEAMECFELSLAQAKEDDAVPKPEQTELFALQLLIGRCALNAEDTKKAVEFYLQASSSEDKEQAMQAQLGHLKAVMRSPDPQDATKWLEDKLAEDFEGRRLHDILRMTARDTEHEEVIPKMFTLASKKPDNLKGVVRAMERATARDEPGAELPDKTGNVDPFRDDELVGVLKYYWGLATYIYRHHVASDTVDHSREALRLWEECRDQLSNIRTSSYNAYLVGKKAKAKIAQHYFDSIMEKSRLDDSDVEKLAQLAKSEAQVQGEWDASGYLASLYAHYERPVQSKAALVRKVRLGLEVLSDDTPQNDDYGFYLIWQALAQTGDFSDATVALSLCISRDVLAHALSFPQGHLQDHADSEKQQVLEKAQKIAKETLEVVKSQLSETSPQQQRVSNAREHIESGRKTVISSSDELEGSAGQTQLGPDDQQTLAAYHLIEERLSAAQQELIDVKDWCWSCDGRTTDGKKCTNEEVYHCIYCGDVDFCEDCLGRLRERVTCCDMEFTVCNSRHRWLKLPLPSSGFYVGPLAASVRVPNVSARQEDHQILEVSIDEGRIVDLKEWKAEVAREWGILLEGGEAESG
jgi:tetratricopeptide (TPR) repeat protein